MTLSTGNGILAKLAGNFIAGANQALPSAESHKEPRMCIDVEGGHLGRVRITYERMYLGRNKSKYWAWVAIHAEDVSG